MKKTILSFITVATLSIGISANASAEEVKVQDGDTLWDIAKQKNVSVEEIIEWNNLSGEAIKPKDILKLKENYKVVSGDSLWDIAQDNDVSIKELKKWNDIDSHIIHPGDELIIEESSKTEQKSTTPQKEDPKVKGTSVSQSEKSGKKAVTVSATAYTANCEGCSGTTKTGIDLKANPDKKVIAVDPTVIPLGSKVHVEGYGVAIAGDIGGGIKGKEIDIFVPTKEQALQWGRQEVEVKILE